MGPQNVAFRHVPVFAVITLYVSVATGRFLGSEFMDEALFRQVRSAVTPGKTLNGKTVAEIARTRISDPGVVISVENRLPGIELQGGETFEEYGKEKLVPPEKIEPGTQEIMVFDRSAFAQGAAGIVAYKIMDGTKPRRFAIIFSVPWNQYWHRNWYGLSFIKDDQILDSEFYSKLSHHKGWYRRLSKSGFGYASKVGKVLIEKGPYIITATMTKGKRAILRVKVEKKHEETATKVTATTEAAASTAGAEASTAAAEASTAGAEAVTEDSEY